jgi:16S rRNA (cytidine1402-2'-O)-methyltransferase
MNSSGILYVVATPIGNLEDITLRAVRVLGEVYTVLCEDTRTTRQLLTKHQIATPTMSYHAHSARGKEEKIIELLREGKDLALVSDAGTPAISDPGARLVALVREQLPDARVVAIPGPSALVAAYSVSGITATDFLFLGFLPHKKGRETLFREIAASQRPVVVYESPHRLIKTLATLAEKVGGDRRIVVSRELTKIYEETRVGRVRDVYEHYLAHPGSVRGEVVIILDAPHSRS